MRNEHDHGCADPDHDARHRADQHRDPRVRDGAPTAETAERLYGPQAPAGKEHNWLQTNPDKGWFVILRLYSPLQPFFDKSWRPSEIAPHDPDSN